MRREQAVGTEDVKVTAMNMYQYKEELRSDKIVRSERLKQESIQRNMEQNVLFKQLDLLRNYFGELED